MSTFVGTWIANLKKSRRHADDQFQHLEIDDGYEQPACA